MAHPVESEGYEVRRWIGRSPRGESHVGVAPDESLVAIKTIELRRLGVPSGAELDPALERMIRAIKGISHPCVANVRDVIVRDGVLYLIEDFLYEQRDLTDILRRQRFIAPEAAWKLACQLCHGVHFLHERGILHLRLRPENILIGKGGLEARITDAGIMAMLNLLIPDMDRAPWVGNSICPDWLEGGEAGRHCDTYSIGVIMREALQNGPEWNAKEQTIREEIQRFAFLEVAPEIAELETDLRREPKSPDDAIRWVRLRRVINEAAHPDSEMRFATAGEMGKAIARARYTDKYGLEEEEEPERRGIPGLPQMRKRSLVAGGVVFCQLCGRPATQGEAACKSCNGPLTQRVEAPVEGPELDIELQEIRDWFAERGDEMAAKGKSTGAETAYRMSAYRSPEVAQTWADLGDMYCINRKFDLALEAYQEALRLRPTDPALHLDLGLALLATRKPKEAQSEFTWVLNSHASSELRLAALTQLGAAFAAQKRHKEAVEVWRGVLEEKPYDVGVHCCLAGSYLALTNYARAYEHIKIALRANPGSARAQMALRRLDQRYARAANKWDTKWIFFLRLPVFLMCALFGWPGIFFYVVVTAIYEIIARVDFGELMDRISRRRRGEERGPRDRTAWLLWLPRNLLSFGGDMPD